MKPFATKHSNKGSIELLIVIPMLALMAWGIGYVYLSLGQKNRLERAAWVYGMSLSHKSDVAFSRKQIEALKRPDEGTFTPQESRYCYELAASPGKKALSFPVALAGFLVLNCPKRIEISTFQKIESAVAHMEVKNILPERQGNRFNDLSKTSAKIVIPGDDFKDNWKLKQAMWFQLMIQIKKEPLPLQLLGITEFQRAFGSTVPSGDLNSAAISLIAKFKSSQLISGDFGGLASELDRYKKISGEAVSRYVHEASEEYRRSLDSKIPAF